MRRLGCCLAVLAACVPARETRLGNEGKLLFGYRVGYFGEASVDRPLAVGSTISIELGGLPFAVSVSSDDTSIVRVHAVENAVCLGSACNRYKVRTSVVLRAVGTGFADLYVTKQEDGAFVDSVSLRTKPIAKLVPERPSVTVRPDEVMRLSVEALAPDDEPLVIGDDVIMLAVSAKHIQAAHMFSELHLSLGDEQSIESAVVELIAKHSGARAKVLVSVSAP
jgi:hypothetical protein